MRFRWSWLVAAIMSLLLAVMLLVAGVTYSEIGNDAARPRDPVGQDTVPDSVIKGGTVVDTTTDDIRSEPVPERTIVLTFDDGPDPTWTPRVLEVLRKHNVKATFFVVGSMVTRFPDLVRQITESGSEVGVHTFTHPDLGRIPGWRLENELTQTQLSIVGASGVTTRLFRPPFSSSPDALDDVDFQVVRSAGDLGYLSVFTDTDSRDWARPGVDAIVKNSTPPNGQGAVVLMHDAGGDRSQTVAALDRLIPSLQQQGYRFTTVSEGFGIPSGSRPAAAKEQVPGSVLVFLVRLSLAVVAVLKWILVVVGVLAAARLILLVIMARRHARRRHRPTWRWGPPVKDPVSVIVPAYNESANIEATVRSAIAGDHPVEVIVVDDGSTDGTADLVESLGLPNVRVIRQPNSGKAAALNNGIANASHELIVMVDGDTEFQPDTVHEIVQPFADTTVGAVAGNVKIANRDTFLTKLQHIEYVMGFNVDRRVHDLTHSMPTIPGAGGAFRKRVLQEVGGLSAQTLAEDTDLTIAIGRAGWRIVYQDTAVTWTEAPTTVRQLWQQRFRWTFGTMQAIWKHRKAIVQRGPAGRMGRFGLLHVALFQILLPVAAPVIDVFLLYGLLFLDPTTTVLLWCSMLVVQGLAAAFAFGMDRESKEPLWLLPAQQLLYRQLMYVVLVQSLIAAASGIRVRWQHMRRVGVLTGMASQRVDDAVPRQRQGSGSPLPFGEGTWPMREHDEVAGPADEPRPNVPRSPEPVRNQSRQNEWSPKEPTPESLARQPSPRPAGGGRHRWERIPAQVRTSPPVRERWLDLLRAFALVRVMVYHTTGWAWLSFVFPAMGVMFAAAGSLAARSMDRGATVDVVVRRIRRLLPPLWLLAVVMVPLMLVYGWSTVATGGDDEHTLDWASLILWVFPILDPPSSDWIIGENAAVVLWYLRAYLWFVLLTPLLLRAFRARPVITTVTPLALVGLETALGFPISNLGEIGTALLDLFVFGACWMLGFAHRDGMLQHIRPALLVAAVAVLGGLGAWWAATHPTEDGTYDINEIPLGQALISAAAVLVLLRFSPSLRWLDRTPVLGRTVSVMSARAITIYLWHNTAIDLAVPVTDWIGSYSLASHLAVAAVLTACAVFAFGWVEDLAARKSIRLLPPGPRTRAPAPPRRSSAGATPTRT